MLEKKIQTKGLRLNALGLYHSATATFAIQCSLFLFYKWILKLNNNKANSRYC